MSWFRRPKDETPTEPELSAFERRTLPGIPDVFTGEDATLGAVRRMARRQVAGESRTAVEEGLARTLLAVLNAYEQEVARHGD